VDVHKLGLSELRQRCAEESGHYFHGQRDDTRFCYELFRRAFVENDQLAWDHLYNVYKPLIVGWVTSSPAFPGSGEEIGYFVNRAVEKMWSSISADKFSRFGELSALLRYLKMCVGSVVIDHVRMRERMKLEELDETPNRTPQVEGPSVEEQVGSQFDANMLWDLIHSLVTDRREKYVILGSFVYNLKPREILTQYPGEFTDVKQIYRIKENLIARLRRNPELIKSLSEYVGETG
jgi:hypothetical protein